MRRLFSHAVCPHYRPFFARVPCATHLPPIAQRVSCCRRIRPSSSLHPHHLRPSSTLRLDCPRPHPHFPAPLHGSCLCPFLSLPSGATEALNLVAQTWGMQELKAGDEIIISVMEHHANLVPWQLVAEKTGHRFRCLYWRPVDRAGAVCPQVVLGAVLLV